MSLEGLDCWDDYPMEHGCICGNDCAPPSLPLDPKPYYGHMNEWVGHGIPYRSANAHAGLRIFDPRPGYNQNREEYAE